MIALVTGAAGFIGSHLSEALLEHGFEVRGLDCFTDAYDPEAKERNIAELTQDPDFELVRSDLRTADLEPLLDGVDVVLHQAALPGVRASWSSMFEDYVTNNILATHRLLEAVRRSPISRFVYASSSSVYGNALRYPTEETDAPHPHSPYGVTKLSAENLSLAYAENFGLPVVALRYFSVYGPRQRPDMGIHRVINAALGRGTFSVFGSGAQVRDVTYVGDVVEANIAAVKQEVPEGTVANIAGGSKVSVNDVIESVGRITGRIVPTQRSAKQPGDVDRTGGAIDVAREILGWKPSMDFEAGLRRQIEWQQFAGS